MDAVPDFATKPTLHGRLVTLRPFRDGDAEVMAQILSDPEVRRLTGSVESTAEAERPQPLDDRLRDWYATRNDQADRLDLAIEDAASGTLVGEVVLNEVDLDGADLQPAGARRPRGARPGARHRGGRPGDGLRHRAPRDCAAITLEVFEFNPRARRVYEKVGYP